MKFRCEKDTLADAVAVVGRATSARGGALPVLSGALFTLEGNSLTVTGTDLDLTITRTFDVDGDTDGSAVITARLLSDIVRALEPGAVTIDVEDSQANISSGRSEFSVRTLTASEFPQVPVSSGSPVTIDATELVSGLAQVVRAASGDDARPILTGVLLQAEADGLRLEATDSYRLAVRTLPGTEVLGERQQVLIPSRALAEVVRLLGEGSEVELTFGERDATFRLSGTTLTTRLIEGDFPNTRQLLPDDFPNRLKVDRLALLDALRRVRLLARESTPVRLTQHADSVELSAITQDVGQAHETVDATYDGEELTVAFNPEYLLDGIEAINGDEIVLETRDALKPAVLRDAELEEFTYLLMPVRVS